MGEAGLAVELSYNDFPLAFPTQRYVAMVRTVTCRYCRCLMMRNWPLGWRRFGVVIRASGWSSGIASPSCWGSRRERDDQN